MSVWEEIKARLALEEVIADYVPVQNMGQNFRCKCPFHDDKTPSLIISPDKGIWHCFGCGAGGDMFKFVMDIENISKAQTLQKLAKKAGVELEKLPFKNSSEQADSKKEKQELLSKYELGLKYLDWVSGVYHQILLKLYEDRQHSVTQYCLSRGLDLEILKKFRLGYAPKNSFLFKLATKHNLNLQILEEIGVLKINPKDASETDIDIIRSQNNNFSNKLKDKFSDRLMIPIADSLGKTVGFTARILPYDKSERPKYLNSPQTEWFNKSQIWYGLHLSRPSLNRQKTALIVEGNMDVVAAFKYGHENALASQGTSFTEDQVKILSRLVKTVHLAFDNDDAGKLAGQKFFKIASKFGLEVMRVLVPEKFKDLDDFLSSSDYKLESKLKTVPYLDYLLNLKNADLTSSDSTKQKQSVVEFLHILAEADDLSQDIYLTKLSQLSKIGQNTLFKILSQNLAKEKLNNQFYSKNINSQTSQNPQNTAKKPRKASTLLVNFQKLATMSFKKPDLIYGDIEPLFQILKVYLDELQEYLSFSDYVEQNKDLLNMIGSQELYQIHQNQIDEVWIALNTFIDSKLSAIMLQNDLKEKYYQLRKII